MYKRLLIHHAAMLANLLHRRKKYIFRPGPIITLKLKQLTDEENKFYQRKLNLLFSNCACEFAGFSALVTAILYVILWQTEVLQLQKSFEVVAAIGFLSMILAGLMGKIVGKYKVNSNINRLINEIRKRIEQKKTETTPL